MLNVKIFGLRHSAQPHSSLHLSEMVGMQSDILKPIVRHLIELNHQCNLGRRCSSSWVNAISTPVAIVPSIATAHVRELPTPLYWTFISDDGLLNGFAPNLQQQAASGTSQGPLCNPMSQSGLCLTACSRRKLGVNSRSKHRTRCFLL